MSSSGWIANPGATGLLDYLVGNISALETEWARQAAVEHTNRATYLCLLTSTLSDASITTPAVVANEVSGTGYIRQSVPWGPAAPSSRQVVNLDKITFGPFADTGGLSAPIVAAALVTCATGSDGLVTMYWTMSPSNVTTLHEVRTIPPGDLGMGLATS